MQPLQASDSLAWPSGVSYWGANWHSILTQILAFWHASSKGLQEAFTGSSKPQDLSKCIVTTVQTHIYPYMVIHNLTRATRQAYIPLKKSVTTMTNLTFACARACLRVDKWWLFFSKRAERVWKRRPSMSWVVWRRFVVLKAKTLGAICQNKNAMLTKSAETQFPKLIVRVLRG